MAAKKSVSVKSIYAVCLLSLWAISGIIGVFTYFNSRVIHRENTADVPVVSSFLQQYPFAAEEENASENSSNPFSVVDKYCALITGLTKRVEAFMNSEVEFYEPFEAAIEAFRDATQKEVLISTSSAFIKLPNGYLAECFSYCPSEKVQNNILSFSRWLQERDIPLLTLITPDKADDSMTVFPEGIDHGYSQMFEEYIAFLEENSLPYLDAKKMLLAENSDFYSWFYKGDIHWNARAAFAAAQATAKHLDSEFGIAADADILQDNNFSTTVYRNALPGCYGRTIGSMWKEDMEILYPLQGTSFHIEAPSRGIDRTGSFEDVLIDGSRKKADVGYSMFLHGLNALTRIENKTCQNGTRILVIGKSFMNNYCPYLANTVQYLDVINASCFDGSIRSFIEQTQPDAVITCMGVPAENYEAYLNFK